MKNATISEGRDTWNAHENRMDMPINSNGVHFDPVNISQNTNEGTCNMAQCKYIDRPIIWLID